MSIKSQSLRLGYIIGLAFCLLPFALQAQNDKDLIELKEFYRGCGIIFSDSSQVEISKEGFPFFYTPSIEEVRKSESIFSEKYQEFLRSVFDQMKKNYSIGPEELKEWDKTISSVDVKEQFRNYYRQYAGFKNKKGERLIIIYLLNFSKPKKAKEYFGDWKEGMIVGLGEFYEANTKLIYVNIDQGELIR